MSPKTVINEKNGRQHVVFKQRYKGQLCNIRTACAMLICNGKVMMIQDATNELEFPGGKVEETDGSIYDTLGREIWEELFLQGNHEGDFLHNWSTIKTNIVARPDVPSHAAWIYIMERVFTCKTYMRKKGATLKTVYFIIRIPEHMARYLTQFHGAYPVDVRALIDARNMVSRGMTWRNIKVPVQNARSRHSMPVRSRELFCMPKNVLP